MFAPAARTFAGRCESISALEHISALQAAGRDDRKLSVPGLERSADMREMLIDLLFTQAQYLGNFLCAVCFVQEQPHDFMPNRIHLDPFH